MPGWRDWIYEIYGDPDAFGRALEPGRPGGSSEVKGRGIESRIICRNGQYKDVEFRITYLGDRRLLVLTDVTARKRAEEELHAEKQNFQTLSESSPVGMVRIGVDDGFKFKYTNPKFKEFFGQGANRRPTWPNGWSGPIPTLFSDPGPYPNG